MKRFSLLLLTLSGLAAAGVVVAHAMNIIGEETFIASATFDLLFIATAIGMYIGSTNKPTRQ